MPFSLFQTEVGRWMTMDVGDPCWRWKPDIVLENGSVGPTVERSVYNWKKGPPFMVLKIQAMEINSLTNNF